MKKKFIVGDVITFDEANQLKNWYFSEAAKNSGYGNNDFDLAKYSKLKREFKKKTEFKILSLP